MALIWRARSRKESQILQCVTHNQNNTSLYRVEHSHASDSSQQHVLRTCSGVLSGNLEGWGSGRDRRPRPFTSSRVGKFMTSVKARIETFVLRLPSIVRSLVLIWLEPYKVTQTHSHCRAVRDSHRQIKTPRPQICHNSCTIIYQKLEHLVGRHKYKKKNQTDWNCK